MPHRRSSMIGPVTAADPELEILHTSASAASLRRAAATRHARMQAAPSGVTLLHLKIRLFFDTVGEFVDLLAPWGEGYEPRRIRQKHLFSDRPHAGIPRLFRT
jgi:hypothetical protein